MALKVRRLSTSDQQSGWGVGCGPPHESAIILYMTTTLPLADVRDRLSPLVTSVETTHERVVITKNGRPAAVLISYEDLESLQETLEILSEPGIVEEIRDALTDSERFSMDDIRRDLEARSARAGETE
ncbi:hypothetical protein Cs7R123_69220 [Catellatospora sp. TT07R-123]|nr:hypothetical protein Cs7R123_69220 [Catellatospora sp. TT07R-123]